LRGILAEQAALSSLPAATSGKPTITAGWQKAKHRTTIQSIGEGALTGLGAGSPLPCKWRKVRCGVSAVPECLPKDAEAALLREALTVRKQKRGEAVAGEWTPDDAE